MNPNGSEFKEFFKTENELSEETAKTCEGIMSIVECERALKMMESNKHQGQIVSLQSSTATFGMLSANSW